jgi:pantoate--beta-alanine ligase
MELARTARELDRLAGGVLVPTMGWLHEGHLDLVRLARARADADGAAVVVSIYVNPTQFNEASDFDSYPRDLTRDLRLCEAAGVDAVFAPPDEVMYPDGRDAADPGELPAVATEPGLEDRSRPGHFEGVCAVCRRLFALTRPAAAVFGEKDWQQLQAIRRVVEIDASGIDIVPGPTRREPDGLAMSSRNVRLSPDERERALAISRALRAAHDELDPESAEEAMAMELAGLEVEYAVVRDAETLGPVRPERPGRALVAVRVGGVRLIDNAPWGA